MYYHDLLMRALGWLLADAVHSPSVTAIHPIVNGYSRLWKLENERSQILNVANY